MPKVSSWELDKKTEGELIGQLWDAFSLLKNKTEVIDFLKAILTPTETLMLAKRIELAKLHQEEIEITTITKALHITRTTAYRWKDRYIMREKEFDNVIMKLKRLDKDKYNSRQKAERQRAKNQSLPRVRKFS